MLLFVLSLFFFPINLFAVCPICTIGAGATFGVAKALGVSDLIIGILFSSILFSSAKWLGDFFGKKTHNILVYPASFILHYASIYFLYQTHIVYKMHTFLGFDKFLLGTLVGFAVSLFAAHLYLFLKRTNNGKPHFPYQKVVVYIFVPVLICVLFHILESNFILN